LGARAAINLDGGGADPPGGGGQIVQPRSRPPAGGGAGGARVPARAAPRGPPPAPPPVPPAPPPPAPEAEAAAQRADLDAAAADPGSTAGLLQWLAAQEPGDSAGPGQEGEELGGPGVGGLLGHVVAGGDRAA